MVLHELSASKVDDPQLRWLPNGSRLRLRKQAPSSELKGEAKSERAGVVVVGYGLPMPPPLLEGNKPCATRPLRWFDSFAEAMCFHCASRESFRGMSFYLLATSETEGLCSVASELIKLQGGKVLEQWDTSSPVFAAKSVLTDLTSTFGVDETDAVSLEYFFESSRKGRALDLNDQPPWLPGSPWLTGSTWSDRPFALTSPWLARSD